MLGKMSDDQKNKCLSTPFPSRPEIIQARMDNVPPEDDNDNF